jgi:RNA polymerase sigma-70 factor, ECF subfamily
MLDIDIQKLRSGDNEAFSMLYETYVRKIYDFLYFKTFNQEIAEDITQETFFKALKKIHSFQWNTSAELSSWLYTIAHNAVIDFFRKNREYVELDESSEIVEYTENFSSNIDQKTQLEEVMSYLNTLSKDQKDILIMRIWDELSYTEIAKITGKTVDACKKIVSRALIQIQSNIVHLCIFAHFLHYIYL